MIAVSTGVSRQRRLIAGGIDDGFHQADRARWRRGTSGTGPPNPPRTVAVLSIRWNQDGANGLCLGAFRRACIAPPNAIHRALGPRSALGSRAGAPVEPWQSSSSTCSEAHRHWLEDASSRPARRPRPEIWGAVICRFRSVAESARIRRDTPMAAATASRCDMRKKIVCRTSAGEPECFPPHAHGRGRV